MQKTISKISLPAIRKNALKIREILGCGKFFAVVKADAYGHGAAEVARYIEDVVDGFCVAIIDEGAELRIAGISKPVLVFTPPLEKADCARAEMYNLTVTVNSLKTANLVRGLNCHIKVNTGMNRYGCGEGELESILNVLPAETVCGVYSHLYAAEDLKSCSAQLEIFNRAETLVKRRNPDICAHLSASGGILRGGEFLKDGARAGILLYGYAPKGFCGNGFEHAMKVYARRTQITKFIGGGVGYNFADKDYENLSVYRLGYADGFSRNVSFGEKNLVQFVKP